MTASTIGNLFEPPPASPDEVTTTLLERPGVTVERIVSTGQSSPPGFWYDQPGDEWVLLVSGRARIEIDGEGVTELAPGNHLLLPAHCRHRVDWTDPAQSTVWLALHLAPQTDG